MSLVLQVDILGEYKNLTAATKGAQTSLQKLNGSVTKVSSSINKTLKTLGFGLSLYAIANFTKESIAGAEAARVADQRLQQVTKSMGLFGESSVKVTADLARFADKQELLTGVTAETTKQVQATLMTFKALATSADTIGGNFQRATTAALDLAAAGFGTAETNAIQLGKALNDPIKGLTALARSGVTFTEQEKERIKTLVESNKLGEAQALILQAIETQVGGTAEATVTASARMNAAFGQIQDAVGLALLPVLDKFSTWLSTPEGQDKLQEIINLFSEIITNAGVMLGVIFENKEMFILLGAALGTTAVVLKLIGIHAAVSAGQMTLLAGAAKSTLGVLGLVIAALETIKWLNEQLKFDQGNIAASGGSSGALNFSGQSSGSSGAGGSNMTFTTPKKTTTKSTTVVQNIKITGTQSAKQINTTLVKQATSSGTKLLIDPRTL